MENCTQRSVCVRRYTSVDLPGETSCNMSSAITSVLLICTCILALVLVFICVWRRRKVKRPPGPQGYLCCGNSFQVDTDRIHHDLYRFSKEFGPIVRINMFGTSVISLSSSYLISEAFELHPVSQFTNDRSANSTSTVFHGRKHIGCANLNGITILLREFHKTGIFNIFERGGRLELMIKDEIKRLHLNLIGKSNCDINPHEYLRFFHKNTIAIMLIGESLSPTDPDADVMWEFIDHLFVLIEPSVDGALRMFPFLRHLPGYYGNMYRQTIEARDKVSKRFFEDQMVTYRPGIIRGLVDLCILTQQEEVARTGTTWLSDDYIRGLIYDTLVAGMTELMKSMRLFMLLMCHHPDVQARLQAEIDTCIGTERFPSADDRNWMPYTMAVMLEIWRYGSQTQLAIPHLCNKDVVLDGYIIEAGSVILPNLYGVHHDEEVWGDPWVFRPDRFLDEAGVLLPSDHKYMQNIIPFSLGKRACPGQDFARSQIFISMTSLLQRVCIFPPENSDLPSADPRLYTKKYPLSEPHYECRIVTRENIVI